MILSVSRRTDIPNYYADWFFTRLREGYALTVNPMNPKQVKRIDLSPEAIDCIVFWTKNPTPMLDRLSELAPYPYYFQFTLTGYGRDIEPGVPHKRDEMLPIFQRLSSLIGPERVIWRYDPFLFTPAYTPEYHLRAFSHIASALKGCTKRCIISFVDTYVKNRRQLQALGAYELAQDALVSFASKLRDVAQSNGITLATCAEKIDLPGIAHSRCIDPELIEQITGKPLTRLKKDANQRPECGCAASVDIGAYHTCPNGCLYCYANQSTERARQNRLQHSPTSPFLVPQSD